jgi:type VI secretion system protein VasD
MFSTGKICNCYRIARTGLIGLLFLAGCASGPKTYEIKGEADPIINRDISGKPLSVVVHVYQLKDAGEFSKLTFDTLASGRAASELLGKDLLEKNEVMLVPGTKYLGTDKIGEEAKYLGVVAFFRQPDQHYWRLLVEADKVRSSGLNFKVQDCYISLISGKPSPIPGQPANAKPVCGSLDQRPLPSPQATNNTAARPSGAQANSKRGGLMDAIKQAEPLLMSRP